MRTPRTPKREPVEITLRAKWAMDGATTLAEAASMLRAEAATLDKLAAEGWELRDVIADDYGFAVKGPPRPGDAPCSHPTYRLRPHPETDEEQPWCPVCEDFVDL